MDLNVISHLLCCFSAFDMVTDYEKALEDIVGLGCERILTSGMETSALEGTPIIKKCIELVCKKNKITIQ